MAILAFLAIMAISQVLFPSIHAVLPVICTFAKMGKSNNEPHICETLKTACTNLRHGPVDDL